MFKKGVYVSLILAILLASCRSTPIQPAPTVATAPQSVSTATKIPQTRTVETLSATATLPRASITATPIPGSNLLRTAAPQATLPSPDETAAWQLSPWLTIRNTSFINPEQGWALFDESLLYQTSDGGLSWVELPRLKLAFRDIQFISLTRGWATADDGLYTTQDGGQNWERVLETNSPGQSMQFINDTLGFIILKTGLNRTTDGGKTWQPLHPETFAVLTGENWGLSGISFINAAKGWALFRACNMPFCLMKLFMTADGGETFSLVSEAGKDNKNGMLNWSRPGSEIYFLDDQHGWFVGNQYFFQYTEDGGKTWNAQWLPDGFYSINYIHMFTPQEGIAAGWDEVSGTYRGVMKTNNSGKTWEPLLPSLKPSRLVRFLDADHGLGLGGFLDPTALLATQDGGDSWHKIGELPSPVRKLQLIDRQTIYAAYDPIGNFTEVSQDFLWATKDAGQTWDRILVPPGFRLLNFYFSSAQTGTAWDNKKNTIKTSDGGKTWQPINPGQIELQNPDLVSQWLVTAAYLYHALPENKGWNPVLPMDTINRFIPFSGTTALMFGQEEEKGPLLLLRTVDGGETWQAVKALPDGILDLDFIDLNQGWAVYGGFVLKTIDGGESWQQMTP